VAIPNMFVEQGAIPILKKDLGIDADSITKKILEFVTK